MRSETPIVIARMLRNDLKSVLSMYIYILRLGESGGGGKREDESGMNDGLRHKNTYVVEAERRVLCMASNQKCTE